MFSPSSRPRDMDLPGDVQASAASRGSPPVVARDATPQGQRHGNRRHADWNLEAVDGPSRCDWSAQVQQDGSLRFKGLSADAVGWSERPFPDKSSRRNAWHQAQQDRWQHLLAVCSGPCLSWTPRDGWYVAAAARPTVQTWRRHRLLGVTGARPKFWLFEDNNRSTARLCSLHLQAFGASAVGAIEAQRQCLIAYIRVYGQNDLTDSPRVVTRLVEM